MSALKSAIEHIAEDYGVGFHLEAGDNSAEVHIAGEDVNREEMAEMAKELKMGTPYETYDIQVQNGRYRVRLGSWTSYKDCHQFISHDH